MERVARSYSIQPSPSAWFENPAKGKVELAWAFGDASSSEVETSWEPADPLRSQRLPERLRAALREYSTDPLTWKMEYFDAGRRLDRRASGDTVIVPHVSASERVGLSVTKYDFLRGYLRDTSIGQGAALASAMAREGILIASEKRLPLEGFAARLALVSDRLVWLGVRKAGRDLHCMFARRTADGAVEVELSELSGSERMLVILAATIEALGLGLSLVLVDAPELGLHPEDHVRVFEGLQTVMREGQLVVATSSPAILRSVPSDQVVVLRPP